MPIQQTEDFQGFIRRQIQRYGTADALARAIGMSLSAFSRGVRNAGTLSVENLLRLAEETGTPASQVLTLAGKHEVAALIERLFGEDRDPLSGPDRKHLTQWHTLDREAQNAFDTIIRALSDSRPGRRNNAHRAAAS